MRESLRVFTELGQGEIFIPLARTGHSPLSLDGCPLLEYGEGLSYSGPMPGPHPAVSPASLWAERKMAPSPEEGLRSAGLFFMVAADGGRAVSLPELCMCVGGGSIEDREDRALESWAQ